MGLRGVGSKRWCISTMAPLARGGSKKLTYSNCAIVNLGLS